MGFMEGQLVMIQGLEGSWRLRRIQSVRERTSVLRLERGADLPAITTPETRMVFWPGPHGGLTVVHGGGNTALRIEFEMDSDPANTVTRLDGLSWIDAGFSLGQRVQVEGDGKTRTITDFVNAPCPFTGDPFPKCGLDSRMVLSNDAFRRPRQPGAPRPDGRPRRRRREGHYDWLDERHGAGDGPARPADDHAHVRRANPNCFTVTSPSGTIFKAGHAGLRLRSGRPVDDRLRQRHARRALDSIVLQGAALQPTYAVDKPALARTTDVFTPIKLTVFGYDVSFDGGTRMGGDTIVVCNTGALVDVSEAVPRPARDRQARRSGVTARDLRRHVAGRHLVRRPALDVKGYEFGPKPFDPFYKIPD